MSFGGGCFWGVEHAFKQLKGISLTECGYQGGELKDPNYTMICQGNSGHAEVVRIEYDPQIISLKRILDAFFFMHDPTQLNYQGNDIGTQYRSIIFSKTDEQKEEVEKYLMKKLAENPNIVTTLESWKTFYPAESDHQNYLEVNPGGYCHIGLEVFQKLRENKF